MKFPKLTSSHHKIGLTLAVALICFFVYFSADDNITIADSVWSTHVSATLYYDQDIDLNKYVEWIEGTNYYAVYDFQGKLYPFFPVAGSLLTAPLIPLYQYFVDFPDDAPTRIDELLDQNSPYDQLAGELQLFAAAILCALSAALLFIALADVVAIKWAVLGAVIYAFGTPVFSTASRAMWQHTPSILFLTLLLLALTRLEHGRKWFVLAGFSVAVAYTLRPTNSISVLIITLFVLYHYRYKTIYYFAGAAAVAIPFIAFNFTFFDSLLPPYFAANRLGSPFFWQAVVGNLISPGRGIILFSPFILFAGGQLNPRLRCQPFAKWLWLILGLHLLIISSFPHWWGGHSNGPRFFTDMMPFLVYLTISTVAGIRSRLGIAIFLLLAAISLLIHANISITQAGQIWNTTPLNIDRHPSRLWTWHDALFLRRPSDYPAILSELNIQYAYADVVGQKAERVLLVRNVTNRPIYYKLTLPRGMSILAAPDADVVTHSDIVELTAQTPIEPNGLHILHLAYHFDTYQLQPEGMTFGAIALESRMESTPQWGGMLVSSIVIDGEQPDDLRLPRDITIEDPTKLFALHGGGWYERETFDTYQWRWSGEKAELYVYSAKPTVAVLETSATGFYAEKEKVTSSELIFTINGENAQRWQGEANTPFSIRLPLDVGWNRVEISHPAGSFSSENEPRKLGFGLNSISLYEE